MTSRELRTKFFDFFTKNGHTLVPSSSLIPADDPTLLFANAGMNQFKDVFLGKEKRSYTRAVSIQKCIRAGGKHNDLDNVGFTKRHLTFFEMMGNFSFGDYFKKEAIQFAWEFLTNDLQLPKEKLYASVYEKDHEAYELWHSIAGLPYERIIRLGAADNFWQMGLTGPCGPCTEIYIDKGERLGCGSKECKPGCSCDRFMEIWNNVFMQFDRQPDGTDVPLKQTGVDTGMGLERLCTVLQNVDSVFGTDLFIPLIKEIEKQSGVSYVTADEKLKAAFHVVADHVRSTALAIADGGMPSNEGRGYVLRKIIRRAALFAQKIGSAQLFVQLVPVLVRELGEYYPDLKTREAVITATLASEVEKFAENLINGQRMLNEYLKDKQPGFVIEGSVIFKLYDTYGFPPEVTAIIANEREFKVDMDGFEKNMEQQRTQSGKKEAVAQINLDPTITTEFVGYTETKTESTLSAIIDAQNKHVQKVAAGELCWIITPRSPLYAESGGQVSDTAMLQFGTHSVSVKSIKKIDKAVAAEIEAPVDIAIGMPVTITVDEQVRLATMKNHTATHLLQAALQKVVGSQIKQTGSLVEPEYLRFDFSSQETPSAEQIRQVENLVNAEIMKNIPVHISQTSLKEATSRGVIAFFGEKYNPEKVRVVEVPGFSAELCGGTHVRATGDIGCFKITEIFSMSAGNRRIVAVTGPKAIELFQDVFASIKTLAQDYSAQPATVVSAIKKQQARMAEIQTELKAAKKQLRALAIPHMATQLKLKGSVPFGLFTVVADAAELREYGQALTQHTPGLYILIGTASENGRIPITFALAETLSKQVDLKKIVAALKEKGIQGGGSTTLVQASTQKLPDGFEELIATLL